MNDQQNNPQEQGKQPESNPNPLLDFPAGSGSDDLSLNFLGNHPAPFPTKFGRYSHLPSAARQQQQRLSAAGALSHDFIEEKGRMVREAIMSIEMFFAQYMLNLTSVAPLDGSDVHSKEQAKTIVKIQFALRDVRDFIIAQYMHRNHMQLGGIDPFFSNHVIPVLQPVVRTEAFQTTNEIDFTDYVHRTIQHYPNIRDKTMGMGHLSAFGSNVKAAVVEGSQNHYLVLPQPEEFVAKMMEFESKPRAFQAY
jgi:hypothetical protein